MPIYTIRDPLTNKKVKIRGDSPPTESELESIFSEARGIEQPAQEQQPSAPQQQPFDPLSFRQPFDVGRPVSTTVPTSQELPESRPPGFLGEIAKDAPEIALGTIGQALGGPIGGGLGAGIGSAGKQAFQVATGSPEAPETLGEFGREVGLEAALGFSSAKAGQLLGRGVRAIGRSAVGRKALRLFSGTVEKGALKAIEALRRHGGRLGVAQATQNRLIDFLDNIARSGLFSANRMMRFDRANLLAVDGLKNDLARDVGKGAAELSDQQFGAFFRDAISAGRDAFKSISAKMFAAVDEKVAGTGVNTTQIKNVAREAIDQVQRIGGTGRQAVGTSGIKDLLDLPETLAFQDAQLLRSVLLETGRDLVEKGNHRAARLVTMAAKAADEAMEASARNLPGDALRTWRKANRFYKLGKDTFENDFIASMAISSKKTPERVADAVFKSGNATEVDQIRNAYRLASKLDKSFSFDKAMNQTRASYLQRIFQSATNPQTSELSFSGLLRGIQNPRSARTISKMLGPQNLQNYKDFLNAGDLVTRASKAGTGAFGVAQMAAIRQTAGLAIFGTGAAVLGSGVQQGSLTRQIGGLSILAAPIVFAHALTNPVAARMLIRGIRIPAGTPQFLGHMTRFATKVGQLISENQE